MVTQTGPFQKCTYYSTRLFGFVLIIPIIYFLYIRVKVRRLECQIHAFRVSRVWIPCEPLNGVIGSINFKMDK